MEYLFYVVIALIVCDTIRRISRDFFAMLFDYLQSNLALSLNPVKVKAISPKAEKYTKQLER